MTGVHGSGIVDGVESGRLFYLWVKLTIPILDILLQRHRDTKAAERFFRKLLKKQTFVPRVIVTDKLKSYE
nr:DDE-type integrase/transposase/recombinase [Phormidium tanganyikae FI6-MK23]